MQLPPIWPKSRGRPENVDQDGRASSSVEQKVTLPGPSSHLSRRELAHLLSRDCRRRGQPRAVGHQCGTPEVHRATIVCRRLGLRFRPDWGSSAADHLPGGMAGRTEDGCRSVVGVDGRADQYCVYGGRIDAGTTAWLGCLHGDQPHRFACHVDPSGPLRLDRIQGSPGFMAAHPGLLTDGFWFVAGFKVLISQEHILSPATEALDNTAGREVCRG